MSSSPNPINDASAVLEASAPTIEKRDSPLPGREPIGKIDIVEQLKRGASHAISIRTHSQLIAGNCVSGSRWR
jgi:hypothetical protein